MTGAASLPPDARRILLAQALRAFAYGFGALLLGTTLEERGLNAGEVGLVLGAIVAGAIASSLAVARWSDRVGRRRSYLALHLLLAVVGAVFASTGSAIALAAVALTGVMSTDIIESGPFTSLEQAMLSSDLAGRERIRGFSVYNAVAAAAGSVGALAAGGPDLLREHLPGLPADQRFFLVFVPVALVGAAAATSLTPGVEAPPRPRGGHTSLGAARPIVLRLSALFATDAFGGGFVVQGFVAYWLAARFDASLGALGVVFSVIGVLQTLSFLAAAPLARRFGLLRTMVFTHLPSNVLLAAVAFAPDLGVAIALLMARALLSQMDVPTRQAYVMALVPPEERTAAAGYTNVVRHVVRPLGPVLAGTGQGVFAGLPFLVAGSIKAAYDIVLWRWFRDVPLPDDDEATPASRAAPPPAVRPPVPADQEPA